MKAFYSDGSNQVKAYLHGSDWQLIDDNGNERWFSVWQSDVKGSLHNAFNKFLGRELNRNQIAGMADKI
jgi:hypothetical protein